MTRNRTSLRGSQPGSPDRSSEDESEDTKSPKEEKTPARGRKGHVVEASADAMDEAA